MKKKELEADLDQVWEALILVNNRLHALEHAQTNGFNAYAEERGGLVGASLNEPVFLEEALARGMRPAPEEGGDGE